MNKITSIHLNGKAFQFEEAAYDRLRHYLDESEAKLKSDPDKEEIIGDLEQAIADKCATRLDSDKDVITAAEMDQILEEMGKVDAEASSSDNADDGDTAPKPPKKLYRNTDDVMLAGVCSGMADYFNVDVALVRLLFVAAAIFSGGTALIVYIVMAIVLPKGKHNARTAQEIVDDGKRKLHEVSDAGQSSGTTKKILSVVLVVVAVIITINVLNAILHVMPVMFWPWSW
jgi:phage shock protein PspC (stress-responsive transcriptional regulator)